MKKRMTAKDWVVGLTGVLLMLALYAFIVYAIWFAPDPDPEPRPVVHCGYGNAGVMVRNPNAQDPSEMWECEYP
jgi:hypothetical protein